MILFLLHVLKPAPFRHGAEALPCLSPVYAQIQGEVRHPGVYAFCASPTLDELIERAGGLRQGDLPSPDRRIAPNSGLTVGKEGEALRVQSGEIPSFYRVTLGLPISINLESEEGLTAVPGIGKSVAKTIVEERTKRGGFKNLDELMGVPGIGPKLYTRVKPYFTL